jgi:Fungal specific transcription factor domain
MPKPLAPIAPKVFPSPSSAPQSPFNSLRYDFSLPPIAENPEYGYFRYFHEKTVSRMSGYVDESIWNRLVLHASENEPSIRHAVIAIGALDMALEEAAEPQSRLAALHIGDEGSKPVSHHQFALQQYAKAIKRMRETLSEPRKDMRNTLIACLLFVCFETFLGNNEVALNETKSGFKLISGWLPQFVNQSSLRHDPMQGSRSRVPYVIEDELIRAFARLDIVAMMFANEELEVPAQRRPNILEVCRLMPETFLSVEEAKMYWDLMWRQTLKYIANGAGWNSILGLDDMDRMRTGELWEKSFYDCQKRTDEHEENYLHRLLQWSSAFEPLFLDSQSHANQKEFAAATSLAVQHKACHLAIAGGFRGEMFYDSHLKTFKEILSLSEALISYIKDRESADQCVFGMERFVTGSVYMVARMCRDRNTRRKAISMLQSTPRREGTWDSVLMAKVATISMEIEEHRVEGHIIPERARIKAIKTHFNMKQRTGSLRYARAKPEPGREHIIEETWFTW